MISYRAQSKLQGHVKYIFTTDNFIAGGSHHSIVYSTDFLLSLVCVAHAHEYVGWVYEQELDLITIRIRWQRLSPGYIWLPCLSKKDAEAEIKMCWSSLFILTVVIVSACLFSKSRVKD